MKLIKPGKLPQWKITCPQCASEWAYKESDIYEHGTLNCTCGRVMYTSGPSSRVPYTEPQPKGRRTMDKTQLLALIYSQVAILEGMKAANVHREMQGLSQAYEEDAFFGVSSELQRLADMLRDLAQ